MPTSSKPKTRQRGGARGNAKERVVVVDDLELARDAHRRRVAERKYIISRTPFPPSQNGVLGDALARLINSLMQPG